MKLGISTASFFNRVQTESCFDILRQMRVDTTEVFLNTYSEYEKPFIDALISRRGTINVHSIHALGLQFEPQLFNSNARVRQDAENIFRKVCYAGFLLGAKYYTFHGQIRLKNREYEIDFTKLCDRLNQLTEMAQSYGIKLSYENVHWAYGNNPEFFEKVLSACPNLYATLDVKQALQGGIEPIKFLQVMKERISTFHFCDVTRGSNTALPGQGKFNFEKFFRQIEKYQVSAQAFMEVYSSDYKDMNDIYLAYEFLTNAMAKAKAKVHK